MADEEQGSEARVDTAKEAELLNRVVLAFGELNREAQQRLLNAVVAFLGLSQSARPAEPYGMQDAGTTPSRFSDDNAPTAKEFLFQKRPQTDVERIACLAYYLTHYAGVPHFKTLDLSKLNTDAAQLKLGNAAQAVDNATKAGFLVPAGKSGAKQLSAIGELYVQALPDKEEARKAIAQARPKRQRRRGGKASSADESSTPE